jgi:hypothetical protein
MRRCDACRNRSPYGGRHDDRAHLVLRALSQWHNATNLQRLIQSLAVPAARDFITVLEKNVEIIFVRHEELQVFTVTAGNVCGAPFCEFPNG